MLKSKQISHSASKVNGKWERTVTLHEWEFDAKEKICVGTYTMHGDHDNPTIQPLPIGLWKEYPATNAGFELALHESKEFGKQLKTTERTLHELGIDYWGEVFTVVCADHYPKGNSWHKDISDPGQHKVRINAGAGGDWTQCFGD